MQGFAGTHVRRTEARAASWRPPPRRPSFANSRVVAKLEQHGHDTTSAPPAAVGFRVGGLAMKPQGVVVGRCALWASRQPWEPTQHSQQAPDPRGRVARLCGAPVSCSASSRSICSMAPIPAVRQKRSNELSTSRQAISRLGKGGRHVAVLVLAMALLSFADSSPRA
jgi:hypothetical protein